MNVKKESVIFARLAWNPHEWKKASPDDREHIGGAAHEALNFKFDKKDIDKDGFIYGYVRWGRGTPKERFCDGGIIVFYTTDPDTNMEYIVGIYGKVRIIDPHKEYPGMVGFWKDKYWVNVRAEESYSMQFPIRLDAERYKKIEKGPRGRFFNYQDVAFAQKIISDELKELNKKGRDRNKINKLKDILNILKSDELFLDADKLAMNNALKNNSANEDAFATDESNEKNYYEGKKTQYTKEITVITRNPGARKKCLDHYFPNNKRYKCQICGFDFEETYGNIGKQFIDVHHIESHAQVSKKRGEHKINPKKDLIPICSNCHDIIHRNRRRPPLEIDEIKNLINVAKKRRSKSHPK
jgi:5-methylcytosine-specific restriction enzyme A